MKKYEQKAKELLEECCPWYIELDGVPVMLPTKKAGWVSLNAAKTALRASLSGNGKEYEDFLEKHIRFKQVTDLVPVVTADTYTMSMVLNGAVCKDIRPYKGYSSRGFYIVDTINNAFYLHKDGVVRESVKNGDIYSFWETEEEAKLFLQKFKDENQDS